MNVQTVSPDQIAIFLGPTMRRDAARLLLNADYQPPVAQGDVLRAVSRDVRIIGIIDGYFENVPAVWHKEILFAMTQGVHVFGSASMGALRAAELQAFGMVGVGAIFEAYANSHIEDDDEVAVTHGPAELGYPILSEAMVNIRRTLSDARAAGVIGETARLALEAAAKALHYKDRSFSRILQNVAELPLEPQELAAFLNWLPRGRADQKQDDAAAMLREIHRIVQAGIEPCRPIYHFEPTLTFKLAQQAVFQ